MREEEFDRMADEVGYGFIVKMRVGGENYELAAFGEEPMRGLRRAVQAMLTTLRSKGMITEDEWQAGLEAEPRW